MSRKGIIITAVTLFLISFLVAFPKEMLAASGAGLLLWFQTVLPSLFPFMVCASLLNTVGAAAAFGRPFAPLVKCLFRVSESAAFPFAMGLFSGYPVGAKITGELVNDKQISIMEGQRLLSFCNNPGILFILGTVATGMLQQPKAGYFMILIVFLSSVTTGILFRFYGSFSPGIGKRYQGCFANEQYSVGELLGESIYSSMETITQIGGFIILFSVLMEAVRLSGFVDILWIFAKKLPLNISKEVFQGLFYGFLEMTNGANAICKTNLSYADKLPYLCAMLSFGGLSVFAQTVSSIGTTSLRITTYFLSKLINGMFAFCYAALLVHFFIF